MLKSEKKPGPLPARLRRLREAAGLSQRALAKLAGLSWTAIQQIENGTKANPTVKTARALAAALGVGIEELIG